MKFWLIFLFLAFSCICATNLSQTRLHGLEAKHVFKLFKEGNASLTFDVRQQPHTRALLFRIRNGKHHKMPMYILSETMDSSSRLTLRLGKELFSTETNLYDENFHRITLVVSHGRFQLIIDCVKIADGPFQTSIFKHPTKKIVVEIGYGMPVDKQEDDENGLGLGQFPGQIREFSADLPHASTLRCAEIVLSRQPRLDRSDVIEHDQHDDDLQTADIELDKVEKQVENEIEERIRFLEDEVQHFRQFINKVDQRIKTVELHQRGCVVSSKLISFGDKQQDLRNCSECQCSSTGQLHCGPIGCPHLKCPHPMKVHGECCPVCGKQCYYNGVHHEHGQESWPKQCVRCLCDNGQMNCQFHRPERCPILDCAEQEIPPNQCCPVCANQDYCASGQNPCHTNAECINQQYAAKCTCKQGFFGNGTTCYDIDECLWDESAREQLGGCRAGTMCINLPGSFKCDCLPGFQKLDDQNCLDLIRI